MYFEARRGKVQVLACYLQPDLHPGHYVFQYATYWDQNRSKEPMPLKSHKAALEVLAGSEKPRFDWYSVKNNKCYVPLDVRFERFGNAMMR